MTPKTDAIEMAQNIVNHFKLNKAKGLSVYLTFKESEIEFDPLVLAKAILNNE